MRANERTEEGANPRPPFFLLANAVDCKDRPQHLTGTIVLLTPLTTTALQMTKADLARRPLPLL